jgi:hypothetical protein
VHTSQSFPERPIVLPSTSSYGAAIANSINRTWEGVFTLKNNPTHKRINIFFNELANLPNQRGIAKVEFFHRGIERGKELWVRIYAAESNYLDSLMVLCEANLRFANQTNGTVLELTVPADIEYAVSSKLFWGKLEMQEHIYHDLRLQLIFPPTTKQKPPIKGATIRSDVLQPIKFSLESAELGVSLEGEVFSAFIESNWHHPARSLLDILASLIAPILLAFYILFSWVYVDKSAKILSNQSQITLAQGGFGGIFQVWIYAHFFVLTLRYLEYQDLSIKITYALLLVCLGFNIIVGLRLVHFSYNTLLEWHFGGFIFTIVAMAIVFSIGLLRATKFLDLFLSPSSQTSLLWLYSYPWTQVIFISICPKTSKEHYFHLGVNLILNFNLILILILYHGMGFECIGLKPEPNFIKWAGFGIGIPTFVMFLQSKLGNQFFLCKKDYGQVVVGMNNVQRNINQQPINPAPIRVVPNPNQNLGLPNIQPPPLQIVNMPANQLPPRPPENLQPALNGVFHVGQPNVRYSIGEPVIRSFIRRPGDPPIQPPPLTQFPRPKDPPSRMQYPENQQTTIEYRSPNPSPTTRIEPQLFSNQRAPNQSFPVQVPIPQIQQPVPYLHHPQQPFENQRPQNVHLHQSAYLTIYHHPADDSIENALIQFAIMEQMKLQNPELHPR